MPDIHTIRRTNLLNAYQAYAEKHISEGHSPKGIDKSFAETLQISPSALSTHKSGVRPIGDKLAAQFESLLGHDSGWFSSEREPLGLTPAEQALFATLLKKLRTTDADGRRRLRNLIRDFK